VLPCVFKQLKLTQKHAISRDL